MGFKKFCETKEQKIDKGKEKEFEKLYDEYKDKNEDELLSELMKNVQKQKRDGTFNYDSIAKTVDGLSPFLTKEQNLKIKDILKQLR